MDFVFGSWAKDKSVRALLLPLSDAAHYSIALPQNGTQVEQIRRPPSRPASPPADDVEPQPDGEGQFRAIAEQAIRSAEKALVLRQNKILDRFTFGSDLGNFFVLKGEPKSEDDVCYINLYHCVFFPDPDFPCLWLQNLSTSTQIAREWPACSETRQIVSRGSARLHAGTWILSLGEGLQFLLHIPLPPDAYKLGTSVFKPTKTSHPRTPDPKAPTNPAKTDVHLDTEKRAKAPAKDYTGMPEHALTSHQGSADDVSRVQDVGNLIGNTRHSRVETGNWSGKGVAIKFCRRPDIPVSVNMWRAEVHALKALGKHQNVVQFFDSNAHKYSITMELVPGLSLERYVDQDRTSTLTETQSMDIWIGAAQGLQWVHEKGFLYNDLKAENTMYDPKSRRTVLIDFGLASPEADTYFVYGGTPCYICPEYLRRQRFQVSDIWSLGILVMFALRLIELPRQYWDLMLVFDEVSSHRQRMDAWQDEILLKVNNAPRRYLELLRRMLSKTPKTRISVDELVTCLQEARHSHKLLA